MRAEPGVPGLGHRPGQRGVRGAQVEPVEAARPDVQLANAAVGPDLAGVGHVLVAEHLGAAHVDERRWQPGQVGGPARGGVDRHVGRAAAVTQVGVPAGVVAGPVPGPETVELVAGGGLVAVVEHGVDEHLGGQGRAVLVAGPQRHPGGQAAARAGPGDRQPGRVIAELGGLGRGPEQAGVAVVERGRVRMLGGHPVLHADHHGVQVGDPVQRLRDAGPPVREDHAAAVDVVHRGTAGLAVRALEDRGHQVGRAVRPGDGPVGVHHRAVPDDLLGRDPGLGPPHGDQLRGDADRRLGPGREGYGQFGVVGRRGPGRRLLVRGHRVISSPPKCG